MHWYPDKVFQLRTTLWSLSDIELPSGSLVSPVVAYPHSPSAVLATERGRFVLASRTALLEVAIERVLHLPIRLELGWEQDEAVLRSTLHPNYARLFDDAGMERLVGGRPTFGPQK